MGSLNINIGFRREKTNKGFRFKDLQIPITLTTSRNDVSSNYDVESVKQSIINLFRWVKGERVLEPEYGNPILDVVYESFGQQAESKARRQIMDRLQRWEPRVQVQDIKFTSQQEDHSLYIEIQFSVPDLDVTNEYVAITT